MSSELAYGEDCKANPDDCKCDELNYIDWLMVDENTEYERHTWADVLRETDKKQRHLFRRNTEERNRNQGEESAEKHESILDWNMNTESSDASGFDVYDCNDCKYCED